MNAPLCHDSSLPSPGKHRKQEDRGLEEVRAGVRTKAGDARGGHAGDSPLSKPEHAYFGDLRWHDPNRISGGLRLGAWSNTQHGH
jgi:hypothetical protein